MLKMARSTSPPGLRWVEPQNLHFTLRFLGMTKPNELSDIQAAVARVATNTGHDFQISLSGISSFRSRNGACILWIGVQDGAETLSEIAQKLNLEFKQLGFAPEPKPFHAHLTIARGSISPALERMIKSLSMVKPEFGKLWARALILFESETRSAGAVYHERMSAKF